MPVGVFVLRICALIECVVMFSSRRGPDFDLEIAPSPESNGQLCPQMSFQIKYNAMDAGT